MPSTFRTAAAVVFLSVTLGLCTVPAHAQPRGAQAEGQGETKVLEEVWHWLTDLWASSAVREQVQKGLTGITDQTTTDPGVVNRGGAYDPNGYS